MKKILLIILLFSNFSCQEKNNSTASKSINLDSLEVQNITETNTPKVVISKLEKQMKRAGLVDIQKIDSTIYIDIKYATNDNFMKMVLYKDYNKAYLQKDVAIKLAKAQKYLKAIDSSFSLLVYDGTRPRHVQQMMWDSLKMPIHEKTKFVSNPKNGSLHNFGAAVDLTIIDKNKKTLDMATPYDFIGKLAYPRLEAQLLKEGKITQKQINNRKLLRNVMNRAGFFGIATEWWHFNSCSRTKAKEIYNIIE